MNALRFNDEMLVRKPPSGIDVETTLAHFAIITYMVDPEVLCSHVHKRFELECIVAPDGTEKALISVVPFVDQDFAIARCAWPKWTFGQTNYRAYVRDSETGEHVVWFFGTALSSKLVTIPSFVWKLPWHRAEIDFDTHYDSVHRRYTRYHMTSHSRWAPATLTLEDSGRPPQKLIGFPDLESGLVMLTHPLRGYYFLRDGKLGTYSIWHDRLTPTEGRVTSADFPLLERLGLSRAEEQATVHSVLIQPRTDFTIYLPPRIA